MDTDKNLQRAIERLATATSAAGRESQAALDMLSSRGGVEWLRLLRLAGADEGRRADGSVRVSYRGDGLLLERRETSLERLQHGALCVLALELVGDVLRTHEAAWRERHAWMLQRVLEHEETASRLRVREGHLLASLERARATRDARGPAFTNRSRQDVERLDHEVFRVEADVDRVRRETREAESDAERARDRAGQALGCYARALRGDPVACLDYWTIGSDELRALLRPVLRDLAGGVVAEQLALWTSVQQHAQGRGATEDLAEARDQVALWAQYAANQSAR